MVNVLVLILHSTKSSIGYSLDSNGCTPNECLAGSYHSTTLGCIKCSDGSVSNIGSTECTRCGAGTQASDDKTTCLDCPDKTYSLGGTSTCLSCGSSCDPKTGKQTAWYVSELSYTPLVLIPSFKNQ